MKRGKIAIEADGSTHYIRLSTNAMAAYQEAAGETIIAAFNKIDEDARNNDFDVIRIRRVFCAMLDGEITEEEAGDLMDDFGLAATIAKIGEAAAAAFPDGGKKAGNPRSRQPKKATS